ncbi:MAG: C40 family peptidase [Eubacteriales bacterium]|nr:C40 family peptidase [Eubacteriales bacterium]
MRRFILTAVAVAASAFILQTNTYADVIDISGAPGEAVSESVLDVMDNRPTQIVENDNANIVKENILEIGSDIFSNGTISNSPEGNSYVGPTSDISQTAPGSMHSNDMGTEVSLPFKLALPNVSNGSFKVAEGSVQLSDGSWDVIGRDKILRGPYYRVLREVTDNNGVEWYVCDISASSIGAYKTADGSKAEELWLKKSDCAELSSIYLNTTNQTRIDIVIAALSQLGKGYTLGGSGEDSYDCSGLVNYAYKQAGVNIPRQSSAICAMSEQITVDQLRPGDILGRPGHVGIYITDGIFVHASENSTGVVSEYLNNYNNAIGFTNYINAVGD